MTAAKDTMFATPGKRAGVAASPAKDPGPAAPLKDSGVPVREEGYVSGEAFTLAEDGSPSAHDSEREGPALSDPDDESLALARQLLEEEALASYAASVDLLRGADPETVSAATGVGAEDMALMQAIMEEDASAQDAFALAEDESLDYEGMLELGTAIGDVRKERWRTRCKGVIESLPRFRYAAEESSAGDDTKCLVCQCEFEDGDDLRRLPCSHAFHTDCVDGWLEENEECPTCRRSVQAPPTR